MTCDIVDSFCGIAGAGSSFKYCRIHRTEPHLCPKEIDILPPEGYFIPGFGVVFPGEVMTYVGPVIESSSKGGLVKPGDCAVFVKQEILPGIEKVWIRWEEGEYDVWLSVSQVPKWFKPKPVLLTGTGLSLSDIA